MSQSYLAELELQQSRDFAASQSQGSRDYQEDQCGFAPFASRAGLPGLVAIVADGMGGFEDGAQASQVAIETFGDSFFTVFEETDDTAYSFRAALTAANNAITAELALGPERANGMGTTLVALAILDGKASWLSVGDSPLYLFRDESLRKLNADHSMRSVLSERVEAGEMTAEDAARDPERNALLSALHGDKIPLIDESTEPLLVESGDLFVIASDGIETLTRDQLTESIAKSAAVPANELSRLLVGAVLDCGKERQDNITISIIKIPKDENTSTD
ncbi:MAG: protein phosphatase 2C domain-containing protein [Verrucomicrobiota bacterium]